MRTHPEQGDNQGATPEEVVSPIEKDIQLCATYDELYKVIDTVGDITISSKDYESNQTTPTTYTVAEIKQIIDQVRDGERSIHDIPAIYRTKALSLLGTDTNRRPKAITF